MSDWQPIETAPKDGTRILAYTSTRYDAELTQHLIDTYPYDCDPIEVVQIISWNDHEQEWDLELIGVPMFWMPLPEPPTSLQKMQTTPQESGDE